jgi:spore maturation protein A
MLNAIWLGLILLSVIFGVIDGRIPEVVSAITSYAKIAFDLVLGMGGIIIFWLGLIKIAEDAGFIQLLARGLRPVLSRLFPDIPSDHPAMGAILLNIASNMLGLTNAATPFGLRAMQELERLNKHPGIASNAMCTFIGINTSSVQLIPTTAIAYLAAAGSSNPTGIVVSALIATMCSTAAAIIALKFFEKLPYFAVKEDKASDLSDN